MKTFFALTCLLAVICFSQAEPVGYGLGGYTVPVLRTLPVKTYGIGYGIQGYGLGYGLGSYGLGGYGYGKSLGLGYGYGKALGLGYGYGRGLGLGYGLGYDKHYH